VPHCWCGAHDPGNGEGGGLRSHGCSSLAHQGHLLKDFSIRQYPTQKAQHRNGALCTILPYKSRIFSASKQILEEKWRYIAVFTRDASAGLCYSNVCPSIMRRYCVKTKKASIMISSPTGSPKTLVFWRQISSPNSKGFPRTGASNKGRSEKFSDFQALSVNISKTVADPAKDTIND